MQKKMSAKRRLGMLMAMMSVAVLFAASAAFAAVENGTEGADTLVGGAEADELYGKGGDDTAYGMSSGDRVEGDGGNDTLYGSNEAGGGSGNDTVLGDYGDDGMMGGPGADYLAGGPDNDIITDGPIDDAADDQVFGGSGDDSIETANAPAAKDTVSCADGVDKVLADTLDDVAADCENVEIMDIQEGEEDVLPTDPAPGGEYSHYFRQNILPFGNYFVPPKFDVSNNYRVVVHPTNQSGVTTSYRAFTYADGRCTDSPRPNTKWHFANPPDYKVIYRNGSGSQKQICVRANVRSGGSKVITGYFLERRGF